MKRVVLQDTWPESWRDAYPYDLVEIYGDTSCPTFLGSRGYQYAYDTRRRQTLRLVGEVLPPGARILDIAAGQGNFSLLLAELGYDVTWNDLRADLMDYVRLKHERGSIRFAPGNVFDLAFPSRFDAIVMTEIIEHVAHPDALLTKAAHLVRPGGYIVMTTPNGAYFRNTLPKFSDCSDPAVFERVQFKPNADGHIFLLHPGEIDTLAARAGLLVETRALFTNPLTAGHIKLETALRLLPPRLVNAIEAATERFPGAMARRLLLQMAVRFRKM